MRVLNVHEREFSAAPAAVGALIDTLSGANDRLWPSDLWPPMRFDRPLAVGAVGGHGPIRYSVVVYEPGSRVEFRFSAPRGFDGTHGFELLQATGGRCVLRHTLAMRTYGPALLTWPLVFRPLHDALIEDSLDRAARSLGETPRATAWSVRVRLLRTIAARVAARPEVQAAAVNGRTESPGPR